jgi:geranylgeranyl diphosphate synthase type II
MTSDFSIEDYLRECRDLTLAELKRHLPGDTRHTAGLYDLMLDYPLRPAKALRPALCLAACRALGGTLDAALPSAVAFELFHNAFLVHDDVEDGSHVRRHAPTLHVKYGAPIAVNVGDGMLAVALEPLLGNVAVLGLGPALRVFKVFARMARESVEGQMMELAWIREQRWDLRDREYLRMVHKKTGWYSFISPVQVGALAAGAPPEAVRALGSFALHLGIAFQIQDDLLSLEGTLEAVGKDGWGDLWEGKYTLPLLHMLRTAPEAERREALAVLAMPRPALSRAAPEVAASRRRLLDKIVRAAPDLERDEWRALEALLAGEVEGAKDAAAVARLHRLVTGRGGSSLRHARDTAERFARRSLRTLDAGLARIPDSVHKRFLRALVEFVTRRSR